MQQRVDVAAVELAQAPFHGARRGTPVCHDVVQLSPQIRHPLARENRGIVVAIAPAVGMALFAMLFVHARAFLYQNRIYRLLRRLERLLREIVCQRRNLFLRDVLRMTRGTFCLSGNQYSSNPRKVKRRFMLG